MPSPKPVRKTPLKYPKTQVDFAKFFPTERRVVEFLTRVKWPNGFRCPRCQHPGKKGPARGRMVCASCHHETSLIADTLFSSANLPLLSWMHALWWITCQKSGMSAVGFQNVMGIGCYQTAWTWLHKLRRAMANRQKSKLSGIVEVDETFIGGVRSGKKGRGAAGKVLVAVAAEVVGKSTGRIRMAVISDASTRSLGAFIRENVERGSVVVTDGWESYNSITTMGYAHQISTNRTNAVPKAHQAMSLLKRWLLGTYQGRIEKKYLQRYLDEFVFRFNRRRARNRGKLFMDLLALCLFKRGVPARVIVREANLVNSEPDLFAINPASTPPKGAQNI